MNEQEKHVYNALSVTEYTAGIDFTPRIDPAVVPRDDIHKILKKLEAEGLTELCYGWGWRAVESEHSHLNFNVKGLVAAWRDAVASGATMLDFKRWFINETIKREEAERNE